MPSQPTLRPFDVAVSLRLLMVPEDRYEPLANALVTSTSAVHRSVARLQQAGICKPSSRTIVRSNLEEFVLHGVRYAFPAILGPERSGVPTSVAHPAVQALFAEGADSRRLVWPSDLGAVRAESIAPLFPGLPAVATRDPRLHELLALVDCGRSCTERDRPVVSAALSDRILNAP